MTSVHLPSFALVLLLGPSGAGKSTFARRHFRSTEVLSSDFFRAMVCDDESDQSASAAAFEILHLALARRLARRRLTVVDATNVRKDARAPLIELARRYQAPLRAIVLNLSPEECQARNQSRSERPVGSHVVQNHAEQLAQALTSLGEEGFGQVIILSSADEIDSVRIERDPLSCQRLEEKGPFDLIGDVHGCFDELQLLLERLGYTLRKSQGSDGQTTYAVTPPPGRKVVFVGDLVDRGPATPEVLRVCMSMVRDGSALCVVGNHDDKLLRKLRGNKVSVGQGLERSLEQLAGEPASFTDEVRAFLETLPAHLVLQDGQLVVAHAGLLADMHGRESARIRAFALYGETSGETDADGLPVRGDWGARYQGQATVVYGHTPVAEPTWVNRTLNIDTGCVFGGRLTALRYPENELVSVPAAREYWTSPRALPSPSAVTPEPPPGS